jgi:hypothetical protein
MGGKPVVCRAVDAATGRPTPEGDVRFRRRRFAYVNGAFELNPRWLPLRYQVIKGYKQTIAEGELTGEQARDGAAASPPARWSRLAVRSWYSGDIHSHHIAPKTCRLEMAQGGYVSRAHFPSRPGAESPLGAGAARISALPQAGRQRRRAQ